MKAIVHFERNVSEAVEIEVKNLEHLKKLAKDNDALWDLIYEQEAEVEEVCGEVLSTTYEFDGKEYSEEDLNENHRED